MTLHIPHRVPIGFHGNWIPDSELANSGLGRFEPIWRTSN
jgi:hypothetical protein